MSAPPNVNDGTLANFFYNTVWAIGYPAFWTSSSPSSCIATARRAGGYILAANHTSPYDVACLIAIHPRIIDFVSITEIMSKPVVGWFFRNMGTFAVDRSRKDPQAVRVILDRLAQGHVVTMFPEGRIPTREQSVLHGGSLAAGLAGSHSSQMFRSFRASSSARLHFSGFQVGCLCDERSTP